MSPRDRIQEISELRRRGGWKPGFGLPSRVEDFQRTWKEHRTRGQALADFVPIRLVTFLEVFVRSWVVVLVDHGPPFIERAETLSKKVNLKFDYAISRAIVGKRVSLGELLAHSLSTNRFEQIVDVFSTLLNVKLFDALKNVHDRARVELYGEPKVPIIQDMNQMCADLDRLFEVRHIATHELPQENFYDDQDLDRFFDAVSTFIRAADERLAFELHGNYPLTQIEMNAEASSEFDDLERDLESTYAEVSKVVDDPDLLEQSQKLWSEYRRCEAELRSGINQPSPGSIAPMIYFNEMSELSRQRNKQLRWWLEREEGEM